MRFTKQDFDFLYGRQYPVEKSYQSDQLIVTGVGTPVAPQIDDSIVNDSICRIEDLLHKSDFSGALDYLESLSQEMRQQWQIQNLTGVICAYCGQAKEAATFFEAALEQQPDDINVMYNLADVYAVLGKSQKAEAVLQRCESKDSEGALAEDIASLRARLDALKRKQVLMVAYYFPPLSGSGVFRSLKFAKYLPQFGWQPTVLSTDQAPNGWKFTDESQVAEIPADMEVIRVPDGISTGRETSLNGDRVQALLNFLGAVLRESAEGYEIFTQLTRSEYGIKQLLTFPCAALSWAWDVVQYIEQNMDLRQFEVIYTTSGPSSAHLIGFYLKQKYGIPWVADYRDPWTFNAYGADYNPSVAGQKLLFELESILLKSADHSLTVEESTVQTYLRHFQIAEGKISSITNGYDEADFSELTVPQVRTQKFTINYSGLIYTGAQTIEPIFGAIRQLSDEHKIDVAKINFHFVGVAAQNLETAAKEYGLNSIVSQTGYLSHMEALQSNLNANLLLLLVGDDARYKSVYTGKFFEYLRSGRPILALAPKDGAVDKVLRETGHGEAVLSTQISQIKAMILREYRKWEKGQGLELLHCPAIERFERKVLTKQLASVLSDVVNRRNSLAAPAGESPASRGPKYLVICNGGYPIEGNPRCMFAHKRVLQYIKAGLMVEAFGFVWGAPFETYEYQGVHVMQGGAPELQKVLQNQNYAKLLIHFVDSGIMYSIQKAGKLDTPMIIWCHGYEVLRWNAVYFNYSPSEIKQNKPAFEQNDKEKSNLLKQLFAMANIHFIFVSDWLKERVKRSVGSLPVHYDVIHNYIDCDFYQSQPKHENDRMKVLSIKSHATKMYANDLTANAIIELSDRDCFSQIEFDLYGSGPLFDQNFGELKSRKFSNVHIHNVFLAAAEMKALFDQNGILIAPTRRDTQGVTTCEAMSAGLAVISCNTSAIPEFIDEDCGSLYEFDNYYQLADEIEYLYYHPQEFLRKSQNAVRRVREQCGYEATIKREIELITKN